MINTTIKRVALLATGDELTNGDILNTNAQYFARQFIDHGIKPGQQLTVSDDETEIATAIQYLSTNHEAIITIGGLGPTADDKTRYGLATALNLDLVFADHAWQWLTELLHDKKLKIPDTNRQQALFPVGATAIRNFNGTAAACYLEHNNKDIFMLPGPPNECLPIFDDFVLNKLITRHYAQKITRLSWLLLGTSESEIAALLQPLAAPFPDCQLGFRVSYPYLEIKLLSSNDNALQILKEKFNTILADKCISYERQTASQQVLHLLENDLLTLKINDEATCGALEASLTTPKSKPNLYCNQQIPNKPHIKLALKGLENYWLNKPEKFSELIIDIDNTQHKMTIALRGAQTLSNVVERLCWLLLTQHRQESK